MKEVITWNRDGRRGGEKRERGKEGRREEGKGEGILCLIISIRSLNDSSVFSTQNSWSNNSNSVTAGKGMRKRGREGEMRRKRKEKHKHSNFSSFLSTTSSSIISPIVLLCCSSSSISLLFSINSFAHFVVVSGGSGSE